MANYPISKMNKEGTLLHAEQPHDMEMAFAYDIHCPNCHNGMLKQTARPLSYNELGLYRCPVCDKK